MFASMATAGAIAALSTAGLALAGPALLLDAADSKVLYAEDLDNQWHPASLTKIMTAYVTFGAIKEGKLTLETIIACSQLANSQGPTKIGLPVGKTMTVEAALQALIIESANDVAVMLAEAVAGSHAVFVEQMNARGCAPPYDAHDICQREWVTGAGAGDDRTRFGQARYGRRATTIPNMPDRPLRGRICSNLICSRCRITRCMFGSPTSRPAQQLAGTPTQLPGRGVPGLQWSAALQNGALVSASATTAQYK